MAKGLRCGLPTHRRPQWALFRTSQQFNRFQRRYGAELGTTTWIEKTRPNVLPPTPPCVVPNCPDDRYYGTGLCRNHRAAANWWITTWTQQGLRPAPDVDLWLERRAEPIDLRTGRPMCSISAVLFGLMKGTSGLELLLALQRRDRDGRADLHPEFARQFYLMIRRLGLDAVQLAQKNIDAFAKRWRDSYPAAVRALLADRESLTVYLRFPREHWNRIRHSNFIWAGRLPGEHSCLSLVWAVLDRASTGWRGFTMTPAGLRLLADLRRSLHDPTAATKLGKPSRNRPGTNGFHRRRIEYERK
jgi:hypothetical protein